VTTATRKECGDERHVYYEHYRVDIGGSQEDGREDAGVVGRSTIPTPEPKPRPACLPTLCTTTVLSTATAAPIAAATRDEQEVRADEPRQDHDVHQEGVADAPGGPVA
jgi:hypothetical protein